MENELREKAYKAMREYVDYDREVKTFREKHVTTLINGVVVKEMELPFTVSEIEKMISMEAKLEELHIAYINAMRAAFQR